MNMNNLKTSIMMFSALTALMISGSSFANLTPNMFRQLSAGGETNRALVKAHVGGAIKAYINANSFLTTVANQAPLFCYTRNMGLPDAYSLAESVINEYMIDNPNDGDEEVVEMLILFGLKAMYPC
jgi:hypothetical protein